MKPMLAAKATIEDIKFPVMASPKLDGIRAIVHNGQLVSRTLKPIPNKFISGLLSRPEYDRLDGELIVGPPIAKDVYLKTNSAVMSRDGEPGFLFYVFDCVHPTMIAASRQRVLLDGRVSFAKLNAPLTVLEQVPIRSVEELIAFEQKCLSLGYEGVVIRSLIGLYKFGRSTLKEGLLLKLKRFSDSEAEITGFEEQMHNGNEATVSELGYTKRSSHKDNLTGMDTLGALAVRDIHTGVQFNIGTGFDAATRQEIWNNRELYRGRVVKYKFFEVGVKDLPRHPVFLGFRETIDL